MRRPRLAVVALRKDVADHYGRLQGRAARGCGAVLLEDWLDAPEIYTSLWAPVGEESFAWRIPPGGDEEIARRKLRLGRPTGVARFADHNGGDVVYVGMLPALKVVPDRSGAAAWVQQPVAGGGRSGASPAPVGTAAPLRDH
jgi:hypothetical protein